LKVALIGLWQDTRSLAPWNEDGWELWGLGWDHERYQFHRAFEMHDRACLEHTYGENLAEYLEKLRCCSRVIVDDIEGERYPFEAVAEDIGAYWCSSVAYMLALAIHEKAEEIGLYGIAMDAGDEYGYQKPNCEYLIGLARGRGIKVHIPEQSPLCKFVNDTDYEYAGRYGRSAHGIDH
jgi:hypothetical protein